MVRWPGRRRRLGRWRGRGGRQGRARDVPSFEFPGVRGTEVNAGGRREAGGCSSGTGTCTSGTSGGSSGTSRGTGGTSAPPRGTGSRSNSTGTEGGKSGGTWAGRRQAGRERRQPSGPLGSGPETPGVVGR